MDKVAEIIDALWDRYGREPTTEEVSQFIIGNNTRRTYIWNFGLSKKEGEECFPSEDGS